MLRCSQTRVLCSLSPEFGWSPNFTDQRLQSKAIKDVTTESQEMLRSRESKFIFPGRRERVAPLCAILSRTPPLCGFPRQSPPQLTQGVEVHKIQGLQKLEGKNRKTFGRQFYLKLIHYRRPVKEAIKNQSL